MPKHDLQDVRTAAVTPGSLQIGKKAAYDRLLGIYDPAEGVFSTQAECRAFAQDVLLALQPDDFAHTNPIPNTSRNPATFGSVDDFDVYGVKLAPAVLQKHGLTVESTWYVKFTVRSDSSGKRLFCLSLHRLEKPLRRVCGWLIPEW